MGTSVIIEKGNRSFSIDGTHDGRSDRVRNGQPDVGMTGPCLIGRGGRHLENYECHGQSRTCPRHSKKRFST